MTHFLISTVAPATEQGPSFLQFVTGGGVVGWIIIILSVIALMLSVMHAIQIRRDHLVPASQLSVLSDLLSARKIEAALEYCIQPENDSYLTRILSPSLSRYLKSPFGAFEIRSSLEEAGQEQTAKLYRSTDALGVIGSIAPLLGLLGTVQGMIGAFDTVATSAVNDTTYYESLAGNISLALITTLQGLIVAIPCVTLFTFFRNRIDAISSEAAHDVEELVLYIEGSQPGESGFMPPAGQGISM